MERAYGTVSKNFNKIILQNNTERVKGKELVSNCFRYVPGFMALIRYSNGYGGVFRLEPSDVICARSTNCAMPLP